MRSVARPALARDHRPLFRGRATRPRRASSRCSAARSDARSGATLGSLFAQYGDAIRDGKVKILIQFGPRRSPRVPDVPLLQDLVTSERDKQIAEVVGMPAVVGPGYWMAPGVPEDRLAAVRKAFEATVVDPAFLATAKQIQPRDRGEAGHGGAGGSERGRRLSEGSCWSRRRRC